MTVLSSILNRVLVIGFFRMNANLFFLLLAFAGGFMRGRDHIALAEILVSSQILLIVPLVVWALYALFIHDFNSKLLSQSQHTFLNATNLFADRVQWLAITKVATLQFSPALLYGIFIVSIAIRNEQFVNGLLVIFEACGVLFFLASALKTRINSFAEKKSTVSVSGYVGMHIPRPYPIFAIEAALRTEPLALMGYKLVGVVVLAATTALYSTGAYDIRLLGLACTFSFFLAVPFVYQWHRFENVEFTLFRRMPFTNTQRLVYTLAILAIFYAPEAVVIFRSIPHQLSFPDVLSSYLFGVSNGFMVYCLLYSRNIKMESAVTYSALIAILWFVLILARVPLILIFTVNSVMGVLTYLSFYSRYEYEG
jgi:hypothetical protein